MENHGQRRFWFSFCFIGLIFAFTLALFWRVDQLAEEESWNALEATAKEFDNRLLTWVQLANNQLKDLAQLIGQFDSIEDPDVADIFVQKYSHFFAGRLRLLTAHGDLYVDGKKLFSNSESHRQLYQKHLKLRQERSPDEPYFIEIEKKMLVRNETGFVLVVPVEHGGQTVALLGSTIELSIFKNDFDRRLSSDEVAIFLFKRSDGQVLINKTKLELEQVTDLLKRDVRFREGESKDGFGDAVRNGHMIQLSFLGQQSNSAKYLALLGTSIPNWSIGVLADSDKAFQNLRKVRDLFYAFLVFELLACLAYLIWIMRDTRSQLSSQIDKEKQKADNLLNAFVEDYIALFVFDLDRDRSELRSCDAQVAVGMKGYYQNEASAKERFETFVNTQVHPDDRAEVLIAGSADNIRKRLAHQKSFRTLFRQLVFTEYKYVEMVIAKVGEIDEPVHVVALGYLLVDDEMNEKKKQEAEMKVRNDLLNVLSENYVGLYYVDLRDASTLVYNISDKIKNDTGKMLVESPDHFAAYEQFVRKLVHPDDQESMIGLLEPENLRKRLAHQKSFQLIFRRNFEGQYLYSQIKVAKSESIDEPPISVAVGFSVVDEEVRAKSEEEERRKRANSLLDGLSREYHSIWLVDGQTGVMHLHRVSDGPETIAEAVHLTMEGKTYPECVPIYIQNWVALEDRDRVFAAAKFETLFERIPENGIYTISYKRQIKPDVFDYHQMAFGKAKGSGGVDNFVLAFRDVNEQMLQELKKQQELSNALEMQVQALAKLEQSNKIVEALASDYSSVYYINLETEELIPYTMTGQAQSRLGEIFNSGITYSDAFKLYVDNLIFASDKAMMLESGSVANIRKQLRSQKSFVTIYRGDEDGNPHFCEMKFVKFSDEDGEPAAVALGFADKDDEIIRRFTLDKLEHEYIAIYMIDLNRDLFRSYKSSFSPDELEAINYSWSKVIQRYAKLYGDHENCLQNEKLVSEQLRQRLMDVDRLELSQQYPGKDHSWHREVFQVIERDEGVPQLVLATHVALDPETSKRMELEAKMRQNSQIIDILASEYSSVSYIELATDQLTPYSMNEATETEFGEIFRGDIPYSEAFKIYVDRMIYAPDKAKMLKAGSLANIAKQLAHTKTFITTYRSDYRGEAHFCEMKFVKIEADADRPTAVALAFADRDAEISARYVDEKIRAEYTKILLVDLENDAYRSIQSASAKGFHYFEGGSYSDAVKVFAQDVASDYREAWLQLSDINYIKQYLKIADRREFIYYMPNQEQTWRRCVFQVVSRENDVPTMVIVTFMVIDSERAEKLNLDAKIAEQKQALEEQQVMLEHALERAEMASKAKTTFLSNMSHDIRTPMNAIIGFTNLAMRCLHDADKVQSYLSKTAISSQHLLSLINDILDMSRIESGKIQLEAVDCTLSEVMHDLSTIIMGQAQAKQLKLHIEAYDIQDEDIVCDKLRLHQVLINLLSNAVKFTPVGGDVEVSVRQLEHENGRAVYEFRVKDNGIGMSPEFTKRIFEPFERERTSTISKTQGTGLGMSITKNIVDIMGGQIEVRSEQGKGSEFTVTLAVKLQEAKIRPSIDFYRGKRVLVCDDTSSSAENAVRLLERLEMRAEWTTSAKEVLSRMQEASADPFRLYLIAWKMDGMDGLELARQVCEQSMGVANVLMMSVYDPTSIEEQLKSIGVTGFLSKPLFFSVLYKKLSRIAGGHPREVTAPLEKIDFAGRRILLVEDNELNREIAQEILMDHGFVVDTAEDGSIAVEKVMASKPGTYDLILMDIQMPVMDGYEATRRIRALENQDLAKIPILAMTANAFAEDRQAVIEAGMNEHIAKPIDIDHLGSMLRKFL